MGQVSGASRLQHSEDLDPLLERVGHARLVLLGEASHGTHEFYAWRAATTRRLIEEKGFSFVAVEGDWPDCYRVHCAVTADADDAAAGDPADVLRSYGRWPTWMWANEDVVAFTRWLREHNRQLPPSQRAGFYGLDVYSLWDSLSAVIGYLREHEPRQVPAAMAAFRCFEPYAEDPQSYAMATRLVPTSCESEVVALLEQVRQEASQRASTSTAQQRGAQLDAEQNANVAAGAEAYYRAVVRGGPGSWNVRDHHMADTLDRLLQHHATMPGADGGERTEPAKAVVWAHNTHVGDARFTDMAGAGMTNLGQLARERHGERDVVLVGFGSYHGSVVAAPAWGQHAEIMSVPPAREGSVEALLHHELDEEQALLVWPPQQPSWLVAERDHRAIGVVYRPQREAWGNYVPSVMGRRYDALCWLDETTALRALHAVDPSGAELATWPAGR